MCCPDSTTGCLWGVGSDGDLFSALRTAVLGFWRSLQDRACPIVLCDGWVPRAAISENHLQLLSRKEEAGDCFRILGVTEGRVV